MRFDDDYQEDGSIYGLGNLKSGFKPPLFISFGFKIVCANLAAGICDSNLEGKDLIRFGLSFKS